MPGSKTPLKSPLERKEFNGRDALLRVPQQKTQAGRGAPRP